MKFLNPKTDIAFKKVFGSEKHTDITISFLNSILERKEGELITTVTINQTTNLPELVGDKMSFIDISCTDQAGKKYLIEMQVQNEGNFIERSQFYAAYSLSRQLKKGQDFKELVPVIFVAVVAYDLLPDSKYISHHTLIDSSTGKSLLRHLEFHFIQLSKFTQKIDNLATAAEEWAYFIKNAAELTQVPAELSRSHEITEAFHILEKGAWTDAEYQKYLAESDALIGKEGMIRVATEKGREEGRVEIARELLAEGLSIEKITRITKLSADQIAALSKKN